jgi:hypothetical protein
VRAGGPTEGPPSEGGETFALTEAGETSKRGQTLSSGGRGPDSNFGGCAKITGDKKSYFYPKPQIETMGVQIGKD